LFFFEDIFRIPNFTASNNAMTNQSCIVKEWEKAVEF